MLGKIIALYKAVFLVWCVLLLAIVTIAGIVMIVEGATPAERSFGFGVLIGGAVFVLFVAGNFALVLENNELLRRIADQTANQRTEIAPQPLYRAVTRSEPTFQRKEPKL